MLAALYRELKDYPARASGSRMRDAGGVVVPLHLRVDGIAKPLSFISTTTVFGTPIDVTLSELALECFFPADERTRAVLQAARPERR